MKDRKQIDSKLKSMSNHKLMTTHLRLARRVQLVPRRIAIMSTFSRHTCPYLAIMAKCARVELNDLRVRTWQHQSEERSNLVTSEIKVVTEREICPPYSLLLRQDQILNRPCQTCSLGPHLTGMMERKWRRRGVGVSQVNVEVSSHN